MKIVKIVMIPALIFGVVGGLLTLLPEVIFTTPHTPQILMLLNTLLSVVSWLWLAAKFVIMYYIGKKLDLRSSLRPIIVSILLGGWIGYYVTIVAMLPLILFGATYTSPYFELAYLMWNIYTAVGYAISQFFGNFTPIAIAYVKA